MADTALGPTQARLYEGLHILQCLQLPSLFLQKVQEASDAVGDGHHASKTFSKAWRPRQNVLLENHVMHCQNCRIVGCTCTMICITALELLLLKPLRVTNCTVHLTSCMQSCSQILYLPEVPSPGRLRQVGDPSVECWLGASASLSKPYSLTCS